MKQYILTGILLFTVIHISFGQSSSNIFKRILTINSKIVNQKKDEKRIELYRFYSKYFTDSNIYPTPDAIDLVDAYNKQANFEDIKSNKVQFKELNFTGVAAELQEKSNADRMLVIKPDGALNNSFKSAIETFNQKYQLVKALVNIPSTFKDSLSIFRRQILPAINFHSRKISAKQMEFFLFSLQDINQLMKQLSSTENVSARLAINEMMNDFFEFKANPINGLMGRSSPAGYLNETARPGLYYANYKPSLADAAAPGVDENELANANVYVYTRSTDGKWDQEPKPNSYNVYYGANGLKYSLTPGCDTLSFFRFHPSVPASTLPVVLAKGNYCFVLQDINTHRLFLRPDINLRDNQVIDDTKLIKLCFKVENQ